MNVGHDARAKLGLLSMTEVDELALKGVLVPSPDAVLISQGVCIGSGTILWPGTTLLADHPADLVIGEDCEIGAEGGFWLDARESQSIQIGAGARLLGGGACEGACQVGKGAQILGAIRCRDCQLAGGGSYRHHNPNERGAVLKGNGVARSINLECGDVIQAFGLFSEAPVRRQVEFHPPGV